MSIFKKLDNWLVKMLWHKSDTPETLEQKVFLVRNGLIAVCIITLVLIPTIFLKKFQLLLLFSPLIWFILIVDGLLVVIKRGIKWFLYFYYGGYIILCCFLILLLGGLPNSLGIWGGAFIVFMHALAIKERKVLVVNATLYIAGLVVIGFSYPYLTPYKQWTSSFNYLGFTMNEFWMCLFLVKSFYDSL